MQDSWDKHWTVADACRSGRATPTQNAIRGWKQKAAARGVESWLTEWEQFDGHAAEFCSGKNHVWRVHVHNWQEYMMKKTQRKLILLRDRTSGFGRKWKIFIIFTVCTTDNHKRKEIQAVSKANIKIWNDIRETWGLSKTEWREH